MPRVDHILDPNARRIIDQSDKLSALAIIPPSVKGGMGGFDRQPRVLRGTVPLAISQSFGDTNGLTASQRQIHASRQKDSPKATPPAMLYLEIVESPPSIMLTFRLGLVVAYVLPLSARPFPDNPAALPQKLT